MKTFNYESNCVKYKNCFFDLGEYGKGKLSLAIYGYVENDTNLSHISNVTVNVEEKLEENQVVIDNKFETSVKNLYSIGDGGGMTRGLMMASASGVQMARNLINKGV